MDRQKRPLNAVLPVRLPAPHNRNPRETLTVSMSPDEISIDHETVGGREWKDLSISQTSGSTEVTFCQDDRQVQAYQSSTGDVHGYVIRAARDGLDVVDEVRSDGTVAGWNSTVTSTEIVSVPNNRAAEDEKLIRQALKLGKAELSKDEATLKSARSVLRPPKPL